MKVLHTSDWHLGHVLHDVPREDEHAAFLAWLLDTLVEREVDVLIVAGDVFDVANPGARAQQTYYEFLVAAQQRCPGLDVVVIGGNHDSPARLDAPAELMAALGLRVVGGLPRRDTPEGPRLDPARLIVPLHNRGGAVEGYCVAMPFLRPGDLGSSLDPEALRQGVAQRYQEALELCRAKAKPEQALLVTGHCYAVGVEISALSERRIHCGGEEALPADTFGADADYVALGHLHRPQRVAGRAHVRYSGAPLPLSLPEFDYVHEVRLLDFEGGRLQRQQGLSVPRHTELLRFDVDPEGDFAAALGELPEVAPGEASTAAEPWPFLEVRLRLQPGDPVPRAEVEAAVAGRRARLIKISVERIQLPSAAAELTVEDLQAIDPTEIFRHRFAQRFPAEDLPEGLERAFLRCLQAAEAGRAELEEDGGAA